MDFFRHVGRLREPEVARRELPGGVLLLGERVEEVPSLALGVWVRSGSRHEGPGETGIAHLIEHMVFKGTRRHSAFQIAKRTEAIGGQVDAFTTKESTCFNARVFAGHRRTAVEILGELLSHASFRREMIVRERQVVEEEIHSYDDNPEELIFDLASEQLWDGHPLAHSILGKKEVLRHLSTRDLQRFYRTHYTAPNVVVTAAGRFEVDRLAEELHSHLQLPVHASPNGGLPLPRFRPRVRHEEKAVSQTSICLSRRGPSYHDRDRHAKYVLHTILGSGVSSRLFQKIREEEGLAYSVYSYMDFLRDTGMFSIYLGVDPGHCRRALRLVCRELRRVRLHGVRKWELDSAKAQILTGIFLSYESMFERMSRIAHNELYHRRQVPMARVVESIRKVSLEDVQEAAETLLDPERYSLVTIGPPGSERPGPADIEF